jgi:two-component system phosphate regulon sensor histidine kinase PhoR
MADPLQFARGLVDALDEAALVLDKDVVRIANQAARLLLGPHIERRDVRLAIRHPRVLEHVLAARAADIDVIGIGDPGRSFRAFVRPLGQGLVLLRLVDRSETVSAERMRVDFVANASHELRTPLSAVIGYAETLADAEDLDTGTIARFGGTIRNEARRMLRIVEDLMSLSRIEAGRFVAPSEAVDIAAVIEDSIANAAPARAAADCSISVEADGEIPLVLGDRAQLIQLFDNLISNALRYGCDRPGACVEVSLGQVGERVEIAVVDQGPGIPRNHLPRLTERFYRVDDARSRESGGTGLGLSIVKHIVERHRGTLDIDSTLGVGTRVTVGLPVAR